MTIVTANPPAGPKLASAVVSETLPDFVSPQVGDVFAHWCSIRRGRLVPRRDDIDPGRIASALPHVWIYRWRPERRSFQNVLAGEEIHHAWTFSIRGKFIDEMFGDEATILRDRWFDLLQRPAIAYGRLSGDPRNARYKGAERLSLPLVDQEGQPYGVFGITIYDFDRLHVEDTTIPPLLDVVIVPCAALPPTSPDTPPPG